MVELLRIRREAKIIHLFIHYKHIHLVLVCGSSRMQYGKGESVVYHP